MRLSGPSYPQSPIEPMQLRNKSGWVCTTHHKRKLAPLFPSHQSRPRTNFSFGSSETKPSLDMITVAERSSRISLRRLRRNECVGTCETCSKVAHERAEGRERRQARWASDAEWLWSNTSARNSSRRAATRRSKASRGEFQCPCPREDLYPRRWVSLGSMIGSGNMIEAGRS